MNKRFKIKHFPLVDYNILLEVVAEYVKQHQTISKIKNDEKHMFDLTNECYSLKCFKHSIKIELENHWKPFWVKVKESRTQYSFEIWYANN